MTTPKSFSTNTTLSSDNGEMIKCPQMGKSEGWCH